MSAQSGGFVIAVVDDDQAVLRSLQYLLESADLTVRLFSSGVALLESGCLTEIDCLVSDIDMPGLDGFKLMRMVQTARPGLPIVPGGQYHVMICTVSRPARTAGSASASRRASASEPVR